MAGFGPSSKVMASLREELVRQTVAPKSCARGKNAPYAATPPVASTAAGTETSKGFTQLFSHAQESSCRGRLLRRAGPAFYRSWILLIAPPEKIPHNAPRQNRGSKEPAPFRDADEANEQESQDNEEFNGMAGPHTRTKPSKRNHLQGMAVSIGVRNHFA